jgi:peptidoglycan/LPS O-acetylase OafA/YrhL
MNEKMMEEARPPVESKYWGSPATDSSVSTSPRSFVHGRNPSEEALMSKEADYEASPASRHTFAFAHEESTKPQVMGLSSFVPAIEGMRGIAVLLTIFSHVQTTSSPAGDMTGRAGVSIFFVLSGFLITGVLIHQQESHQTEKGKLSYRHLGRFYSDRMVRLFPALLGMVVVTALIHLKVTEGDVGNGYLANATMALTYTSNFDPWVPHAISIWKNTWSLAVEEQFYIVWSLLLPLLLRLNQSRRLGVIVTLIVISFYCKLAQIAGIRNQPDWIFGYYSSPNSFWKMWIGAAIRLTPSLTPILRKKAVGWLGLAMLLISFLFSIPEKPIDLHRLGFTSNMLKHKSMVEPVASISAVCMIMGSLDGNWLMETQFLRFTGRISYSFYLYQVPLLLIAHITIGELKRGFIGVGLSGLAFVFAMISTLYVEEPIRESYRAWRKSKSPRAKVHG